MGARGPAGATAERRSACATSPAAPGVRDRTTPAATASDQAPSHSTTASDPTTQNTSEPKRAQFAHVVRLGTFIVDHDLTKLETLGKALHANFGDRLPAQTLSGVASLALPGMLFEVDAVAVRQP
ncbi:RidA family protein [Streptomyces prunicolor]|uniref:RidA family protein n=1 Tax=Streptomyces prunicolor TaxID=67348 RepID=UPI003713AED2